MDADCIFSLGLVLGMIAGALVAHGAALWRGGRAKMRALKTEKEKIDGMRQKAKERYQQGLGEIPGALFLIVLGLGLFAFLLILILSNALF